EVWRESAFPEGDWQRQRDRLVISQKSEVDRLESLASRAFLMGIFGTGHPFGRPIGGTPEGLSGLTHAQLAGLRDRLNRPQELAVIMAGDFDESTVVKQAEELAAALARPSPADAVDLAAFRELGASGSRLIVVDKPGALQAVIRLGQPGMMANDADRDALGLWNLSLGGLFTSRLNHVLREQKGLTYGVRSGFDIRRDLPGAFVISSSVQHDRCAEAIAAARQEVFSLLGEHPLTKDEMEDARRNRLEATAREDENCSQAASRLVDLWLSGVGPRYSNSQIERYQSLTLANVHEAAHRRMNPTNWLTVLVADWSKVAASVEAIGFDAVTVLSPADVLK
ncbi:MAG: M16 family metallopeptidase, partial [bacterium]